MNTPAPNTPASVRIGSSLLLGIAVASTALPLGSGFKVIALIVTAGASLLLMFNHPYRHEVRKAVEARGGRYKTTVNQVFPLLPLWLALMILPTIKLSSTGTAWIIAAAAFIVAAAYSYVVIPHMDGTAHMRTT